MDTNLEEGPDTLKNENPSLDSNAVCDAQEIRTEETADDCTNKGVDCQPEDHELVSEEPSLHSEETGMVSNIGGGQTANDVVDVEVSIADGEQSRSSSDSGSPGNDVEVDVLTVKDSEQSTGGSVQPSTDAKSLDVCSDSAKGTPAPEHDSKMVCSGSTGGNDSGMVDCNGPEKSVSCVNEDGSHGVEVNNARHDSATCSDSNCGTSPGEASGQTEVHNGVSGKFEEVCLDDNENGFGRNPNDQILSQARDDKDIDGKREAGLSSCDPDMSPTLDQPATVADADTVATVSDPATNLDASTGSNSGSRSSYLNLVQDTVSQYLGPSKTIHSSANQPAEVPHSEDTTKASSHFQSKLTVQNHHNTYHTSQNLQPHDHTDHLALDDSDALLSALDAELETSPTPKDQSIPEFFVEGPNGLRQKVSLTDIPEFKHLKEQFDGLLRTHEKLKQEHPRYNSLELF